MDSVVVGGTVISDVGRSLVVVWQVIGVRVTMQE